MKKILAPFFALLALLLSFSAFASVEDCTVLEMHPSIVIEEESARISVIAECDGSALQNAKIKITYPSGETSTTKTSSTGEIFLETSERGRFIFEFLMADGALTNEKTIEFPEKEMNLTVTRNGDTYTVCSDSDVTQFEVVDNGTLNIIPAGENNCADYTTESGEFSAAVTEFNEETEEFTETVIGAGKRLRIEAPEEVFAGQSFVARVFDNSEPAEGATVKFMGEEKKANADGEVVFTPLESGELMLTASKEGLASAEAKTTAVEELQELSVEFPPETMPGKLIEIEVKAGETPVEGAIVSLGETKKATNEEGLAFFSVTEKGMFDLSVSKKGFNEFFSTMQSVVEEIPRLEIIAPQKLPEGHSLRVSVESDNKPVEGATVVAGEKEMQTGTEGAAVFTGLNAGKIEISASKEGFEGASAETEIVKAPEQVVESGPDYLPAAVGGIAIILLVIGIARFYFKRRRRMM